MAQAEPVGEALPSGEEGATDVLVPADGALIDRFVEEGALLDEVAQQKQVFAQMLRREVQNTIADARKVMADNPALANQDLKLALQNVERAPELGAGVRAQLVDKLQTTLREVQRAASIKDELDRAQEAQIAADRERRLLMDRLARDREKVKQLVDRFDALLDERTLRRGRRSCRCYRRDGSRRGDAPYGRCLRPFSERINTFSKSCVRPGGETGLRPFIKWNSPVFRSRVTHRLFILILKYGRS